MTIEMSTLGENASIIMGQSPPGDSYNKDGHGAPLLNGPTEFGLRNPVAKQWTTNPKKFCKVHDVLFCVRGATAGRLNVADREYCLGRGLAAIRGKSGKFDTEFLRFVLANGYARFQSRGVGSTFINISGKELASFPVPDLPLAEQKRIAGILDAADALRAKRRESLAQLDTLLQSTFLDMFGDPVTNPMGWEVVKFQEVGSSRLGKMLDKGKQAGDCQFPYLANFNVQWGRFELNELRQMDFDEADRQEFALRNGDLLICEGGEVGRTAIWRQELEGVYFQKALHRVRLDRGKAVPEHIRYYMWFMAEHGGFSDFTNSATIAHITGVKLKNLPVPLPPLDLQRRFATIVESVEQQKARQQAHLAELDTFFLSLQSRAFRGDL